MVSPANTPEIEFDALEVPAGIAMKATVAAIAATPGLHLLMCTVPSSPPGDTAFARVMLTTPETIRTSAQTHTSKCSVRSSARPPHADSSTCGGGRIEHQSVTVSSPPPVRQIADAPPVRGCASLIGGAKGIMQFELALFRS